MRIAIAIQRADLNPYQRQDAMQIITAKCAHEAIRKFIDSEVEEFWVLALGPSKSVLQSKMLFRGTVDACLVHPRDIFRFACAANASSIIIAHNHPSGDTSPSAQDILITRRLIRAAKLMEIPLLDHLIVSENGFSSMAQEGWCRFK